MQQFSRQLIFEAEMSRMNRQVQTIKPLFVLNTLYHYKHGGKKTLVAATSDDMISGCRQIGLNIGRALIRPYI